MKIKNTLGIFIVWAFVVFGFIFLGDRVIYAQSSSSNAAQGIQISPALVELNAAAGQTYNIDLSVTNVTSSDLDYTSSVGDFEASDETGSPHIITDGSLSNTVSVVSWVSSLEDFSLEAHDTKNLTVSVTIPQDAEPGGHYGVISFSGATPDVDSTGVGLSASAGALLLIRVDGEISEEADLASFYASKSGNQGSFFENGPITFVTRVENIGNVHVKPVGSIEVRDMFGGLVETMQVNESKSNVLPKSIRRFESTLDKDWMFGRYSATLAVGYGTTGQAITSTVTFWVVPYKLILVCLFILLTVIFILSRVIKVYNKHIIAKSKRHESQNKDERQNKKS